MLKFGPCIYFIELHVDGYIHIIRMFSAQQLFSSCNDDMQVETDLRETGRADSC